MSKFFNSLSKLVAEGYSNLSEKAEEITKIGRVKLEIIAIKRDIEKTFVELGGRFYESFNSRSTDDMKDNEQVKELISKIKNSEERMSALKEKLTVLRKEEGVDLD